MVRAASDARSPALLLLKGQYQSLGKEATSIAQQYNRQLRLIHAGAAAMTALLTLLSSDKMKSLASFGASAPAIWQTAAFCLSSFIFYLLWRVAENRYEMISASLGLTLCERKINHILGESVLIWYSEIIPRIWSTRGFGTGIQPSVGVFAYAFILAVVSATGVPLYIYCHFISSEPPLGVAATCLAILFTLISPIVLMITVWQMAMSGWRNAHALLDEAIGLTTDQSPAVVDADPEAASMGMPH